jgi:putative colanic acid biosynthesis glycosyltransferase
MPEVTVITLVKDNQDGLLTTYNSLFNQLYKSWEMLVVCAESVDSSELTASFLAKKDSRVRLVIQNGKGIYQAMNLGLEKSTSKYVWFMNSGDIFADSNSLIHGINEIRNRNVGVVVGGYGVQDKVNPQYFSGSSSALKPFQFSLNRRLGCHQSMIYNREILWLAGGFDENFQIAADFLSTLKVINVGGGWRTEEIYSVIEPGGVSSLRIRQTLQEKQMARGIFFGEKSLGFIAGKFWTRAVLIRILLRNIKRKVLNS